MVSATEDTEHSARELRRMMLEHATRAAREPQRIAVEDDEEPIRSAPVQKFGSADDLLYRRTENAPEPAPAVDIGPSVDDPSADLNEWFSASFALHSEAERKVLAEAIAEVGAHIQDEMRQELEAELIKCQREISTLRNELCEVKGLVGGLVTLLGQQKPKIWTP